MRLNAWFNTQAGRALAQAFTAELASLSPVLHGDKLLQLGQCGTNPWLDKLAFKHKWIVDPVLSNKANLTASYLALPIERYQIDCIISPLIMDNFSLDKHPLDELDSILKCMGYIIFFGVNPWSLWRLVFAGHFSPLSLKRFLLARGYKQCYWGEFYFIPPVSNSWLIGKLSFLNEMGKLLWPCPPGFYCLIFQKQPSEPFLTNVPASDVEFLSFA